MRIKLFLLSLSLFFVGTISAQSFFKALPKSGGFGASVFGTNQWNFRPVVSVLSYSIPGNEISTGGGVAYELNSQDPTTKNWTSIISISGLLYYNVPLAQKTPANIIGFGTMIGVLNNHILAGAKYDGHRVNFEIGTGINFNN